MAGYLALVAEATNALSGVLIVSCLIVVTLLILRFQHGDPSSVVRVQHQPVQVAVQKLFVPYTLQLSPGLRGTLSGGVRMRCGVSGRGCLVRWWWGVRRGALASLLHSQWHQFRNSVIDDLAFPDLTGHSKLLEEGNHELELQSSEGLELGPLPRECYPLVVVQLDTERQRCDSQLGSVVTVLHLPDRDCPEPSRILYQYLKQCTGQLTMLTTLYTQSNGVNATTTGTSHGSEEENRNSDASLPADSTTPANDADPSVVDSGESIPSQTDDLEFKHSDHVTTADDSELEATKVNISEATVSHESKCIYESRTAENNYNDEDHKNRIAEDDGDHDHGNESDPHHLGVIIDYERTKNLSDPDSRSVELNKHHSTCSLKMTTDRAAESGLYSSDVVDACLKKRLSCRTSSAENVSSSSHLGLPLLSSSQEEFHRNEHAELLNLDVNEAGQVASNLEKVAGASHMESRDASAADGADSASEVATESHFNTSAESSPDILVKLTSKAAAESPTDATAELTSNASAKSSSDILVKSTSNAAAKSTSDATAEQSPEDETKTSSGAASEPPSDECVVCQVERVAVALLPCCHVCVCFPCFQHLMAQRQTCPLCRQHVSAFFVV